ncbi:MAG: hypothetical protein R3324_09260 [Halobacteriales archaeon]|nr:hypothetical protein [Halobacteriales archaeon]
MAPGAAERDGVSLVGYHDLEGRPGFKIALQEVDGHWYLYYAGFWHSGWGVLDVTDPSNPTYLDWIDGPDNTLTLQVQVADGLMVTSLEKPRAGRGPVDGPEADPASPYEEGIYLWDVRSDPRRPTRVGHYQTGGEGTHRNFYVGGDLAYLASVPGGEFTGRLLEIVDVSDPSHPERVSRWWWPGQRAGDGVEPTETYYLHGPAYVRGDRAYLSYGSVGAIVLDVSDPAAPEQCSRLDFGDFGSWLGTHSAIPIPDTDLMVVNDEAILEGTPFESDGDPLNYAVIADISDIGEAGFVGQERRGPTLVSWLPHPRPSADVPFETYHDKPGRFGPHNQHHYRDDGTRYRSSETLAMTWFNAGLRLYDISNPLAPTEVAHSVPEKPARRVGHPRPRTGLVGTFEDVVIDSRGYIYCTDPQQGLFVLESDRL